MIYLARMLNVLMYKGGGLSNRLTELSWSYMNVPEGTYSGFPACRNAVLVNYCMDLNLLSKIITCCALACSS